MLSRPSLVVFAVGAAASIAAGAGLAGCADLTRASLLTPAGVDASSPIASQVRQAAARNYAYPSFRDVPARPTDVRDAGAFKGAVVESIQDRRTLRQWAVTNPAMTSDTEGFAAESRAAIPPDVLRPLDAMASESTEAYAARMRKLAAAPPPLPRGPAPQPLPPPPPSRP